MVVDILQVATQKPITKFVQENLRNYIDGDIVSFKYGGIYYTRIVMIASEEELEEDVTSKAYGILLNHIRKQILKSWIFQREECKGMLLGNKKPIYRDEMGEVRFSV